jgi:hypothetical protein
MKIPVRTEKRPAKIRDTALAEYIIRNWCEYADLCGIANDEARKMQKYRF